MLLRPDLMVGAVHELTPELLHDYGIKAVMVDLDDTLVASDSERMDEAFGAWLKTLNEAQVPTLIFSNGSPRRVARFARSLKLESFALVGKPLGLAFRRGLAKLGTSASETAMVGDQLFTDILGANLAGLTSILVAPLSRGGLPHTRAARRLEALILRGFEEPKGGHGGRSLYR